MSKMKPPITETIVLTADRDGLHSQLMNKVRLNRYDMKFMVNIAEKYILRDLPLSPGQNELYEKIVHKYRKQLRKLKVNYKDILALKWKAGIVKPEVLRAQTFFRIVDVDNTPEMEMYFNFNKKHIEDVRALTHDDENQHLNRGVTEGSFGNGQKYNFNFTNTTKIWHGPFNVYLFKKLYEFAEQLNLKIEDSVTDVVNALNATGTKEEWTPSVRIVGNRLYINHITESMLPMLDGIDPEDMSATNIERFANLGLEPPENYAGIARFIDGASSTSKQEIKTVADVTELKDYINACDRKAVFFIDELDSTRYKNTMPDVIKAFKDCESWGPDSVRITNDSVRGAALPVYNNMAKDVPLNTPEEVDNLSNLGYNTLVTTTPLTSLLRSQSKTGKFALEADKVIYISITEPK